MRYKHIIKLYHLLVLTIWFVIVSSSLNEVRSQDLVQFTDQSTLIPEVGERFHLSAAVADINGDYRDDLIQYSADSGYIFHIQLNNGEFFSHNAIMDPLIRIPETLNIGDLDNSGENDILSSGFYNGISIINGREDKLIPIISDILDIDLFAQGSSMSDINNDGWLDVVMSHDDASNIILMNDGTGHLIESNIIDFNTNPVSDNSGNYSSIWFDADNDNDLDLYIVKCRANVNDPNDPRRINALYINNNGVFSEEGITYNLALSDQSWAADSGDLDNDGDIDLLIVNHGTSHVIMEQVVGGFIRHATPINTEDTQVSIADFNNDGFQDILVSGIDDNLLLNQGDLEFIVEDNPFGTKRATTFALGDINQDGYMDANVGFVGFSDELHVNDGGHNNYVKFSLSGTSSNRSGIGAKITIYHDGERQVRWLKSGTAYGITNSLNLHFGLRDELKIDSMMCLWPSGIIDTYSDIDVNKHYVITENESLEEIGIGTTSTIEVIQHSVSVYPNPTAQTLRVSVHGSIDKIKILNASGSEIYSMNNMSQSEIELDISHWEVGTYLLNLLTSKGSSTHKFMKI